MGTAIGATIDYLFAQLPAPCVAAQPDCVVVDGVSRGPVSRTMLWIGKSQPDDVQAASGPRVFPVLGVRQVQESFTIPCFIDVMRDGVYQTAARSAAISLYDVVCHLLVTDPGLGGTLSGGWYAQIKQAVLRQPEVVTQASVRAVVTFEIEATNRYQP